MRRLTFTWSVVVLLASAACGSAPPLANTRPTAQALATAILDALERRDRAALEALALTETEFRDHAWPQLPAARPERNLPFSYVWGDLHQKSTASLGQTLAERGGRRYALVDVVFAGETDYVTYRVHRETTLRVEISSGEQEDLRVCGAMLEKDGDWKVFSYVVDD